MKCLRFKKVFITTRRFATVKEIKKDLKVNELFQSSTDLYSFLNGFLKSYRQDSPIPPPLVVTDNIMDKISQKYNH